MTSSEAPAGFPFDSPQRRRRTSARQIEANRRNAQRSTGPKTEAGKRKVSRNAIRHGMYADVRPIASGAFREDPEEIQTTVDGIIEDLDPRNTVEHEAALRIAHLHIQLARFRVFEATEIASHTTSRDGHLYGTDVFDHLWDARVYDEASSILRRDSSSYDDNDWWHLFLAAATFDETMAEMYEDLELDDDPDLSKFGEPILLSLASRLGGTSAAAAERLAALADDAYDRLPDLDADDRAGRAGVGYMSRKGIFDSHARVQARLSASLDRELKRYESLRAITDRRQPTTEVARETTEA